MLTYAVRAICALRLWHHYTCARMVDVFVERDDWDAAEVACQVLTYADVC